MSPSRLPPSVCTLSLWFLGRMEKGVNLTVTFSLNEFVFIKLFDEHPSSTTGPVHIPQPLTKMQVIVISDSFFTGSQGSAGFFFLFKANVLTVVSELYFILLCFQGPPGLTHDKT